MINRKELKERAKEAFKANYWKTVLVSILLLVAGGGAGVATINSANNEQVETGIANIPQNELMTIAFFVLGAIAIIAIISIIAKIFLLNPLLVGCQKFFRENADMPAELDEIGEGFKTNYVNVVLTMLLQDVFLALWTMLFIIPGIVKAYSYRLVPYIIADNPEMSASEAITRSRDLMRGHKMDAFILDLSFLGWLILSGCTLGILGIFYVNPYIFQTDAELYLALKEN